MSFTTSMIEYIVLTICNVFMFFVGYYVGQKQPTKLDLHKNITKFKEGIVRPKLGAVKRPTQEQLLLKRDPIMSDTISEMSKLLSSLFKK